MRISDWSSDVCSSDLLGDHRLELVGGIDGACWVREPGVVLLAASGEGDVGVVSGGSWLADGDADIDGVALGAVAGDGPAKHDTALHVLVGQHRRPALGEGDRQSVG